MKTLKKIPSVSSGRESVTFSDCLWICLLHALATSYGRILKLVCFLRILLGTRQVLTTSLVFSKLELNLTIMFSPWPADLGQLSAFPFAKACSQHHHQELSQRASHRVRWCVYEVHCAQGVPYGPAGVEVSTSEAFLSVHGWAS